MWSGVRARFVASSERIGVYGGTFDPIHSTHVAIAEAALEQAKLDRVLFMVAQCPPHKQAEVFASAAERCAMVDRATVHHDRLEMSALELDREGPSYTADTLEALKGLHPEAALFLIVGEDSLVDIPKWYNPDRILELSHILVVHRPDADTDTPTALSGHYDWITFEESALSSTAVRKAIAAGDDVDEMLDPAVQEYIEAKGLYRARCENAQQ